MSNKSQLKKRKLSKLNNQPKITSFYKTESHKDSYNSAYTILRSEESSSPFVQKESTKNIFCTQDKIGVFKKMESVKNVGVEVPFEEKDEPLKLSNSAMESKTEFKDGEADRENPDLNRNIDDNDDIINISDSEDYPSDSKKIKRHISARKETNECKCDDENMILLSHLDDLELNKETFNSCSKLDKIFCTNAVPKIEHNNLKKNKDVNEDLVSDLVYASNYSEGLASSTSELRNMSEEINSGNQFDSSKHFIDSNSPSDISTNFSKSIVHGICIEQATTDKFIQAECSNTDKSRWKGIRLKSITRLIPDDDCAPSLRPSNTHHVFVKVPVSEPEILVPFQDKKCKDVWDSHHVKMPYSVLSKYQHPFKTLEEVQRWQLVCDAFEKRINSVDELKAAVKSYNNTKKGLWTFQALHNLLEESDEEERMVFFESVLPGIIQLALELPDLIMKPIPLLEENKSMSLSFSQRQIASLLSNAFLCTFPRRYAKGPNSEYYNYPDINFNRLLSHSNKRVTEKLKCLIQYFRKVCSEGSCDGIVTFTRQYLPDSELPDFENSRNTLSDLHISCDGFIEDSAGLLQVDFANKFVGGGVLGLGCVQEEIRFVINPELIVSRLFTERLNSNEVLIVTGAERFCNYKGYANTFEFDGPHNDITMKDKYKRRLCQVICLDATNFNGRKEAQFEKKFILRELRKVYIGLRGIEGCGESIAGVATGNWGCGAFQGNLMLKSLIQLAGASLCHRNVAYFTFDDEELYYHLYETHDLLKTYNITVGQLVKWLYAYEENKINGDIREYLNNEIKKLFSQDFKI